MSKDPVVTRVDDETKQRLEGLREDLGAESLAEAQRRAVDEGLRAFGYAPSGWRPETPLRKAARQLSVGFGLAGVVLVGVGLFLPVTFRVYALATIAVGAVLRGAYHVLGRVEPAVSNRLPSVEVER